MPLRWRVDLHRDLRLAVAAVALCVAGSALADTLQGRVVGVIDGDTIDVLTAEKQQIRVRLCEIDAPEKRQAFGTASKQSLSELVYQQTADIEVRGTGRYGRTIGCPFVHGLDVEREQLRRGMAWAFRRYLTDKSLLAVEAEARAAHRGLWADPSPVPPWEFRHPGREHGRPDPAPAPR